jgi:hypothetical protein
MTTETFASPFTRPLALIGLLAIGGLPTFIISIVLFSIGVSFLASGLGVFVAGVMATAGFFEMDDNPIMAILVGPPLVLVGTVALAALAGYFWLAVKVTRRVLAV